MKCRLEAWRWDEEEGCHSRKLLYSILCPSISAAIEKSKETSKTEQHPYDTGKRKFYITGEIARLHVWPLEFEITFLGR